MVDEQPRHGIIPALAGLAVPIDSLMANPVNTRKHDKPSLDALRVSLDKYGQRKPIVVQAHGRIVRAGNGMLAAAKLLGWTHIAAVVVDEPNVDAVAYEIMDNKSAELSTWESDALALQLSSLKEDDIDLALTGFTSDELDELLGDLTGKSTTEDEPPEPPPVAVSRRGDLWLCGKHRVLCGDSTSAEDVARCLDGAVPFLCVTDPPYGVNYDPAWRNEAAAKGALAYAASRIGEVTNDDRADWSAAWKLFPGDVLYSWHPAGATNLIHAAAIQSSGFVLRMQIIWAKSNFPIGRGDYHVRHEPCWYAVREGRPARRTDDRTQITLWQINLDRNVDGGHSTQKPVECMARPIRNHVCDTVYDPFVGSGTTLAAAEQLHRQAFCIEIEPRYVDVTVQRWTNLTNAEPTLDGDGRTFSEIAEERGVKTSHSMDEVRA